MPNNIKVTSGEQSNSNIKKVNGKTLIRSTTADGEVRWVDPEDYRDFNGKIGYAFYNALNIQTSTFSDYLLNYA